MQNATKPAPAWRANAFEYPTGMVWCPMKLSGMAVLKCARLQKQLGCGSRRDHHRIEKRTPGAALSWPWLRRRGECPERATEKQIRELLLELTPLKLVPRRAESRSKQLCPDCGGPKSSRAERCRRCWTFACRNEPPGDPLRP